MKKMTIRMKLISGFAVVALLLMAVALTGLKGATQINNSLGEITESSTYVDAAMEMKLAVARDMQMTMELLAAENVTDLNHVWQEHQGFVDDFDLFAGALLEGADTPEGKIYAAIDPDMRRSVEKADQYHNQEFSPRIRSIYELMGKQKGGMTISEKTLNRLDSEADAIGEEMLEMIGTIEELAKESIAAAQSHA